MKKFFLSQRYTIVTVDFDSFLRAARRAATQEASATTSLAPVEHLFRRSATAPSVNHFPVRRLWKRQAETFFQNGNPSIYVCLVSSSEFQKLFHYSEPNFPLFHFSLCSLSLFQLGGVSLRYELGQCTFQFLHVRLLAKTRIASMFTVAITVLTSTFIRREILSSGTTVRFGFRCSLGACNSQLPPQAFTQLLLVNALICSVLCSPCH